LKNKKKFTVKPYRFKKGTKNTKQPLEKRTKESLIIIAAIVLVLCLFFVFALRSPEVIQAIEAASNTEDAAPINQSNHTDTIEKSVKPPKYIKKYVNQNPDTVGYITIDGAGISYPVVQADNNDYYIAHGFNKKENSAGAIFMDYRCDIDDFPKTRNIILYGHRMKDGTMFKGLLQYEDQDFFFENRIIEFDTVNETLQWKIFAVFETTTDFYYIDTEFPYDEMWLNFLNECHQLSLYETYMNFYSDDIVLTLSTCTTEENSRFVVMAKLLR